MGGYDSGREKSLHQDVPFHRKMIVVVNDLRSKTKVKNDACLPYAKDQGIERAVCERA